MHLDIARFRTLVESALNEADESVEEFKARGGKVDQVEYKGKKGRGGDPFASKHIGGQRSAKSGKGKMGTAANTNLKGDSAKPVVGK